MTFSAGGRRCRGLVRCRSDGSSRQFDRTKPSIPSFLSFIAGGAAMSICRSHETIDQFDLYEHRRTGDDVDYSISRNLRGHVRFVRSRKGGSVVMTISRNLRSEPYNGSVVVTFSIGRAMLSKITESTLTRRMGYTRIEHLAGGAASLVALWRADTRAAYDANMTDARGRTNGAAEGCAGG